MQLTMQQIEEHEEHIEAPDGLSLYLQAWRPDRDSAAVLAAVHGQGVHGGRFRNLAEYFAPRGYAVYALDLRGHGRSEGARGHIRRFSDYLGDVSALLAAARQHEPGRPVFLLGHSMGGLIVLRYALDRPEGLAGVIAAAPFLRRAFPVPAWKLVAGPILSSLWPGFTASNEVNPDHLSADPGVAAAYRADPLIHDRATARLYTELVAAQAATLSGAGRLALPALLLHGDADRLAAPEGTRLFYRQAHPDLCRYHRYQDGQHELLNEPGSDIVFRDLEAWVLGVRDQKSAVRER